MPITLIPQARALDKAKKEAAAELAKRTSELETTYVLEKKAISDKLAEALEEQVGG